MRIHQHVIHIHGLGSRYEFVHISDAHLAILTENSNVELQKMVDNSIDEWTRNGNTPVDTMQNAIHFLSKISFDALLMSGDVFDFPEEKMMVSVFDSFERLGKEVLFVPGNHEHNCYERALNSHCNKSKFFKTQLKPFWIKNYKEITIMGIDNGNRVITKECINALHSQIEVGNPIIILMHIPLYTESLAKSIDAVWKRPGSVNYFTMGWEEDENVKSFCDLVRKKENGIVAVLAGHVHFNHESEIAPGVKQYVVGALLDNDINKITIKGN